MPTIHNLNNKSHHNHKPALNKIGVTSFFFSLILIGSSGGIANAAPVEISPQQNTSSIHLQSQTIEVSAIAAPIKVVRDGFTATSPEEIAATKAAADAAIAQKAAEEAAAQAALINSQLASTNSSPLPNITAPGQVIPASGIIAAAQQWVNVVPYGSGNHPSDTFSCDGYVQYVFAQNGISLPRGAGAQAALGTEISQANAQAGDLVYWPGAHIGIYDGNGGMYDSPMAGRLVQHRVGSLWGNPVFIRL